MNFPSFGCAAIATVALLDRTIDPAQPPSTEYDLYVLAAKTTNGQHIGAHVSIE
jgi:hypothetical protein